MKYVYSTKTSYDLLTKQWNNKKYQKLYTQAIQHEYQHEADSSILDEQAMYLQITVPSTYFPKNKYQ